MVFGDAILYQIPFQSSLIMVKFLFQNIICYFAFARGFKPCLKKVVGKIYCSICNVIIFDMMFKKMIRLALIIFADRVLYLRNKLFFSLNRILAKRGSSAAGHWPKPSLEVTRVPYRAPVID